jgi:hypothetical protein
VVRRCEVTRDDDGNWRVAQSGKQTFGYFRVRPAADVRTPNLIARNWSLEECRFSWRKSRVANDEPTSWKAPKFGTINTAFPPRAHLVALADRTLEPITLEVECDGEVVDASDRVDLKE